MLYISTARTTSTNRAVKCLTQGCPAQNCFLQEKEPSLTTFCLLDNTGSFCRSDLPQRGLPGDPREQALLVQTTSLQIRGLFAWVSFCSQSPQGTSLLQGTSRQHTSQALETQSTGDTKHQRLKALETQSTGDSKHWRHRLRSAPRAHGALRSPGPANGHRGCSLDN